MPDNCNRVLSIDAGGVKGVYSAFIIHDIERKLGLNFNTSFEYYVGTSIGAVIASSLAYGVSSGDILHQFSSFKNDLLKGHIYLTNRLFEWIDYLFGTVALADVNPKLFIPVYNISKKETFFFSNNSDYAEDMLLADILKAACSDIRIVKPREIKQTGFLFADAGFFAYDPIMFFIRSGQVVLNESLSIFSIGSGLIENISTDLSRSQDFDMVYDTFLYDQFETTRFFFEGLEGYHKIKYVRISEFPAGSEVPVTIDSILFMAKQRASGITKNELEYFYNHCT